MTMRGNRGAVRLSVVKAAILLAMVGLVIVAIWYLLSPTDKAKAAPAQLQPYLRPVSLVSTDLTWSFYFSQEKLPGSLFQGGVDTSEVIESHFEASQQANLRSASLHLGRWQSSATSFSLVSVPYDSDSSRVAKLAYADTELPGYLSNACLTPASNPDIPEFRSEFRRVTTCEELQPDAPPALIRRQNILIPAPKDSSLLSESKLPTDFLNAMSPFGIAASGAAATLSWLPARPSTILPAGTEIVGNLDDGATDTYVFDQAGTLTQIISRQPYQSGWTRIIESHYRDWATAPNGGLYPRDRRYYVNFELRGGKTLNASYGCIRVSETTCTLTK